MIEEGGSFLVPDKNQPSLTVRDAREIEEKRDNNIQNPRRTLEVVEAHRRTQALPWSLPNSHRKRLCVYVCMCVCLLLVFMRGTALVFFGGMLSVCRCVGVCMRVGR